MSPLDLHAAPTKADHDALIGPLVSARGAPTVAVMVTSADGRATSEGRVGPLTGAADQWLLLGVRERAQALLIGAATVRAEGYGGLLDEHAKARRRARGQSPEPHLYVLGRDLRRLSDAEALRPGGPAVTLLHPAGSAAPPALPEQVSAREIPVLRDGRPDLAAVLQIVRAAHPQGPIASEGGPTVLGMLVAQRVLDQLIIAVSPRLEGGAEKRLLELADRLGRPLRLQAAAAVGGFVFLRYALEAS